MTKNVLITKRLKYFAWFGAFILVVMLIYCCTGCATMTLAKHKKVAFNMGKHIEEVGEMLKIRCNQGVISEKLCKELLGTDTKRGYIHALEDLHKLYVSALFAWQEGVFDPATGTIVLEGGRVVTGVSGIMRELDVAFGSMIVKLITYGIIDEDKAKEWGVTLSP